MAWTITVCVKTCCQLIIVLGWLPPLTSSSPSFHSHGIYHWIMAKGTGDSLKQGLPGCAHFNTSQSPRDPRSPATSPIQPKTMTTGPQLQQPTLRPLRPGNGSLRHRGQTPPAASRVYPVLDSLIKTWRWCLRKACRSPIVYLYPNELHNPRLDKGQKPEESKGPKALKFTLNDHLHKLVKRQAPSEESFPNNETVDRFPEEQSTVNTTRVEEGEGVEDDPPKKRPWQYGVLDKAVTTRVLSILMIVSMAIALMSIGAVILSVSVFLDKRMTSRMTLLIIAFNVAEGWKAAIFTVHRIWRTTYKNTVVSWSSPYAKFFFYFIAWVPDALGRISLVINLIITVDRFVILAFPIKSINRKLVVYPRLTIGLVVSSMFLFQTGILFLLVAEVSDKVNYTRRFLVSEIVAEIAVTAPYAFSVYRILHIVASICFRYVPLIVTITLNIMTIVSLMYHHRRHETEKADKQAIPSKAHARKRQNNLMIVGSTLAYSFCVSIKPLIRVVSMLHPTFGEGKKELYLYLALNECALFLDNSSTLITLLSYLKLSSTFRKVFSTLFLKGCSSRKTNQDTSTISSIAT